MSKPRDPSRRRLLQGIGSGLVIAFSVPLGGRFARAAETPPAAAPVPLQANAFLRIGSDNRITVLLAHSEMGQGIWTALPMLIAEELGCDWLQIRVEHAPAAPVYAHTGFGIQATGGSTSVASEFDRYRRVGAIARQLLIAAAAARFGVAAEACRAEGSLVTAGEHKASFGELAEAAAALPAPAEVSLKPRSDWRLLGKPTRRLDSAEKVDGSAVFGMDIRIDGMKTALVARSPSFGATLRSFDGKAALALPGVLQVLQVPSGVAVIGEHFWAAKKGRDALLLEWDAAPGAALDSAALDKQYAELAAQPGLPAAQFGDAAGKLVGEGTLRADYAVPFLAHAAMEPLNCTVRIDAEGCDIWTGTQFQTLDQLAAAKITGLTPDKIRVHTPFLGGGFGRRANPASDFVSEAVQVAKAAGVPVKLVWTREDDMRGGYYRPAFLHRFSARLDGNGGIEALQDTIVGQSIITGTTFEPFMVRNGIDATSVEGAADSPYMKAIPNHQVSLHTPKLAVPVLWWRSVGHTHSAFAMEGIIDELAHAAKQDPLAFRQSLLERAGAKRHLAVLARAAAEFGWERSLPAGHGKGIAVHESFGSYVAQAVEVKVKDGAIRVLRVVCAIDCGVFINPLTIEAQLQSAVVYGMSAALQQQITFKDGRVVQSNYNDFEPLRIDAMPAVSVHIVDSGEPPGGVGEPGTPPIAPAIANAVFAATGQRLRRLPLALQA